MLPDLWCSRELDFLTLDPTGQHNPSLHEVTIAGRQSLRWFWTVDVPFAAWCVRTARKATQANATIPNLNRALATLRERMENIGVAWSAIEVRAVTTVALPGLSILAESAGLASVGLGPRWDGWERCVRKSECEPAPATTVEVPGAGAGGRKRFANDDRLHPRPSRAKPMF